MANRPTLSQFSERFDVSPDPFERLSAPAVRSVIFASDSPLSLLLRAFLLSEDGDISGALSTWDRVPASPISMNNKGKLLLSADLSGAVSLFIQSADRHYAIGLMNAAHAFLRGVGVSANRDRMRSYIQEAADQGHLESMCISSMEARHFDLSLSARYLRAAARKAEPQALHMYGLAIEGGIAFPGDRATDYARVGAALGYATSLNNLGTRAVPDFATANALWQRAAATGLSHSCYNLAVSYRLGRGIARDDREAARWMRIASDQGFTNAMFDFAMMLRDGVGVERDEAAADELCARAAERRNEDFRMGERARADMARVFHTRPR